MLRITAVTSDPTGLLLIAEGRLVGPWVEELETALANAVDTSPGAVSIDLSAVGFIDAKGVDLLNRIQNQGVGFQAVSPYVQELLGMKP